MPIYNFVTHRREERMVPMYGANVIIFEGIFAFHDKQVVDLLDMKVKSNYKRLKLKICFLLSKFQSFIFDLS